VLWTRACKFGRIAHLVRGRAAVNRTTNIVVVVLVAAAGWWAYSSHIDSIKNGPQGDPVRTVETFMNTVQTFSGLLWKADVQENLRRDLEAWQQASKDGDAEMPESLKQLGMADPAPLFSDERFGKNVLGSLVLFEFDSYSVQRTSIRDDSATVHVSFVPLDIMGMRSAMSGLGAQQSTLGDKPVEARFELKKHWHTWRIEDMGGQAADLTRPFRGLGG
jgi:hypothetical protein